MNDNSRKKTALKFSEIFMKLLESAKNVKNYPQYRYVWNSKNSPKSGRSLIHCFWTTCVATTSPPTWFSTYSLQVPPVIEDAPLLPRTAAPTV